MTTTKESAGVYRLTDQERAIVGQVRVRVLTAKANIFDLNVALDKAQQELRDSENGFNGALAMLLQQNNLKSGELSPDMATITSKEEKQ